MATDPTVKGTMTSPLLSRRNILLGGFGIAATATVAACTTPAPGKAGMPSRTFGAPAPLSPSHDYHGARVSCIGQEKDLNPRFAGHNRQSFIDLMGSLNLPRPEMMDEALPANMNCGNGRPQKNFHGV